MEIYDDFQRKFKSPKSDCWIQISEIMNKELSPKYIYTIVIQNRYDILDKLNLISKNDDPGTHTNQDDCNSDTCDILLNVSKAPSNSDDEDCMKFDLSIPYLEWKDLIKRTEYARVSENRTNTTRSYNILEPYKWADVFYHHFFATTRLPCCLSFKNNKIHTCPSGSNFLEFTANCSSCFN